MDQAEVDTDVTRDLDRRLQSFNLLPSRWFHPQRCVALWPSDSPCGHDANAMRRFHRHVSASFLRQPKPGYVQRLDDPLLPVFLADDALFERLLCHVGLVVLGPAIRRVIEQDEVRLLREQISEDRLTFARREARSLWTADPPLLDGEELAIDTVEPQMRSLGAALLLMAALAASEPVSARGLWRLSSSAQEDCLRLPASLCDREVASALTLSTLSRLDPVWLSVFPRRT